MKKLTAILLACLVLLTLAGCGSSSNSYAKSESAYVSAPAAAYSGGGFRDDGYGYAADEAYVEAPAEAPMPEPEAAAGNSGTAAPALDPEKIIYSASVNVETTDFDASIAMVDALVARYGGFVESSSLNGNNYYSQYRGHVSSRSADYVLRIPSSRFNELMGSLSELGNIPYSHSYTENVTAQYYDVQARLKAYEAQGERLLEMMKLAETVEDVILLESRLSDLRYQIESLQSTLNNWDRRVSYSTVSLTIKEVHEYTPEQKEDPTYWDELKEALQEGFYNAGQVVKDLLVFLVELIPVLVICIPVIWLLVLVVKKLFHFDGERAKARREARKAKKAAAKAAKAAAKTNQEENP